MAGLRSVVRRREEVWGRGEEIITVCPWRYDQMEARGTDGGGPDSRDGTECASHASWWWGQGRWDTGDDVREGGTTETNTSGVFMEIFELQVCLFQQQQLAVWSAVHSAAMFLRTLGNDESVESACSYNCFDMLRVNLGGTQEKRCRRRHDTWGRMLWTQFHFQAALHSGFMNLVFIRFSGFRSLG